MFVKSALISLISFSNSSGYSSVLPWERKSSSDYITEMICTLSLLQCAFNLLYFLLKEHLLCYTKVKIIFCYMPLFH